MQDSATQTGAGVRQTKDGLGIQFSEPDADINMLAIAAERLTSEFAIQDVSPRILPNSNLSRFFWIISMTWSATVRTRREVVRSEWMTIQID